MTTIAFMPQLLTTMCRQAEAAFPDELCGLLIGREMAEPLGRWRLVEQVLQVPNLAEPARRNRHFLVDPKVLLQVEREAADNGRLVLGVYHSHPDGEARPSAVDRELAWPVYSYVILSVHQGRAIDITSWLFDESADLFHEQTLVDSTAIDTTRQAASS